MLHSSHFPLTSSLDFTADGLVGSLAASNVSDTQADTGFSSRCELRQEHQGF